MKDLTKRQQMILDFIKKTVRERGYPPTLREIGAYMGIRSTNGVNDHLAALERKGTISRDRWTTRGMRVVGEPVTEKMCAMKSAKCEANPDRACVATKYAACEKR